MTDENQPQIHVANRPQNNADDAPVNVPAVVPNTEHPHGALTVNTDPSYEAPKSEPTSTVSVDDFFVVTNVSNSNLTTATNPLQIGHHIIVDTKHKDAMIAAYGSAALNVEPLNDWLQKEAAARQEKEQADKEAAEKLAQENQANLDVANAEHEEYLKTLPPANVVPQTQHVPHLRNPAVTTQPGNRIDNTNRMGHSVVGVHPTQSDMIAGVNKSPMMIFPTSRAPTMPAKSTPVTVPIPQAQIAATRPGIIGTDKTVAE